MKFRFFLALVLSTFFGFSSSAFAATVGYTDSANITTNNSTGLQWLNLNLTAGVAYNDAVTAATVYEGGGWRYATNNEVRSLFDDYFVGYYSNDPFGRSDSSQPHYSGQSQDVLDFGSSFSYSNLSLTTFNTHRISYGLYEDADSNLRMMGTILALSTGQSLVYGEFTALYNPNTTYASIGTWLVRDSIVATPIPSAAFLFAPALMGFLGFRRKLKSTTA